jgi:hypothetical protein
VTFSRRRSLTPPRACVCAPLAFSHKNLLAYCRPLAAAAPGAPRGYMQAWV